MSTREKHLYYLSELKDYKVNSKDPDIRGWHLHDLDNRKVGKIDNLLVNKELGKVVYVDVEVDQSIIDTNHDPFSANPNSKVKEFINKEGENHVIIPIGLVNLNLEDKYAYTDSINYQTFAETKRYESGTHISRDYEHHVLGSYDRRREHLDRDDELRRTKSAYSDGELEERELRRREEIRRQEELRHRDSRNETDAEARMRREKENLKYKNEDYNRPIDDHHRALHHHGNQRDLNPERTLDDDANWVRDDREIDENDDPYVNRRRRRSRISEDFYDRKEFYNRD